jgi:Rha family phage regulatory protein
MNSLTIIKSNGQYTIDSREVAEMTEVRHSDLLEKINGYTTHLTNGKFRSSDFFIPSTYVGGNGENRPCYLITRKGCDMVANKMTGEKGVLFTAEYVTKFEEMEKAQRNTRLTVSQAIEMMQLLQSVSADKLPLVKDILSYAGINIRIPSFNAPANDHIMDYIYNSQLHGEVKAATVYSDYVHWCARQGFTPVSKVMFGRKISACGIGRHRTHDARFYLM